jgi:hypothetical protein
MTSTAEMIAKTFKRPIASHCGHLQGKIIGAANRTRTCDPVITNDVLYQLSYCGEPWRGFGEAAQNART